MNAGVKSRQFCSVCKQWLEMDIVPTSDGDDDDGVIWYRCPQCQGFLPKLKNAVDTEEPTDSSAKASDEAALPGTEIHSESQETPTEISPGILPETDLEDDIEIGSVADSSKQKPDAEPTEDVEPIHEYAALLAEVDPTTATPYRPWAEYEVGQCVHHMAWDDCGVVVTKETLPGNRNIIKVYFETAGVVRLIEKSPR